MDFETLNERAGSMTYEEAVIQAGRAITCLMTVLDERRERSNLTNAPG
jgi:hypothetical protein